MRILLTSDLHYKLRQFDWLFQAAPDFDAVVIAGDHIDASVSLHAAGGLGNWAGLIEMTKLDLALSAETVD